MPGSRRRSVGRASTGAGATLAAVLAASTPSNATGPTLAGNGRLLSTRTASGVTSVTPAGDLGISRTAPCPGTACITVTMTGDVLLHPPLWQQARRDARAAGGRAKFDFRPLLADQRRLLTGPDLAICHLETPLAPRGGPYRGYPRFSVHPRSPPPSWRRGMTLAQRRATTHWTRALGAYGEPLPSWMPRICGTPAPRARLASGVER